MIEGVSKEHRERESGRAGEWERLSEGHSEGDKRFPISITFGILHSPTPSLSHSPTPPLPRSFGACFTDPRLLSL